MRRDEDEKASENNKVGKIDGCSGKKKKVVGREAVCETVNKVSKSSDDRNKSADGNTRVVYVLTSCHATEDTDEDNGDDPQERLWNG